LLKAPRQMLHGQAATAYQLALEQAIDARGKCRALIGIASGGSP
jgi:hypothetical protein